jgi:hypothetical protein
MSVWDRQDGQAFRLRAEECRAIAQTFADRETRETMLAIARDYDCMAERLEQAEPSGQPLADQLRY